MRRIVPVTLPRQRYSIPANDDVRETYVKKLFLCLGVTKGGTTWLHWCLTKHPAIADIPRKEIHYFMRQYGGVDRLTDTGRMHQFNRFTKTGRLVAPDTKDLGRIETTDPNQVGSPYDAAMAKAWGEGGKSLERYKEYVSTLDWYKSYIRGPVDDAWYAGLFDQVPEGAWPVDFSTTTYTVSDEGYARMAAFAEDTRAILILRDPVDRLWSHLKFHAEVTGEIDQLPNWSVDQIRAFAIKHRLPQSSFYADAVERFMRHFPEDKRMIVDFGDLKKRPEALFAEILQFLELDPMPFPDDSQEKGKFNASKVMSLPRGALSPMARDYQQDLQKLVDLGVSFARPWITNAVAHANERPDPAPKRKVEDKPKGKRGWGLRSLVGKD